ncbi:MAG: NAD(P)-binding protein [Halieaceae bacterium]|jgi:spermidine dehydrogenase|nr:NAD(P)-binding protein [Halieaceae bacterium]
MKKRNDRSLGMGRAITRRDFINGVAAAAVGAAMPNIGLAGNPANYYPPGKTGLRGNHPGSYDTAHALVWQGKTDWGKASKPDAVLYDLIVIGAGISGLSAAHFYRQQHPDARILILDNHDDFGGHAKRNEFEYNGKTTICYGGTQILENPSQYSAVSQQLLKEIGISTSRFEQAYDHNFYRHNGLKGSTFFNQSKYGFDKLIPYSLLDYERYVPADMRNIPAEQAVEQMPLSENAKSELLRLLLLQDDLLSPMTKEEQYEYLQSISYKDFLIKEVGITEPEIFELFAKLTTDSCTSIETASAIGILGYVGLPGLQATAFANYHASEDPYIHHFPDGNAGVARLLVRKLIPQVAPGSTMDDVVLAKFDYSKLDLADSNTRLRLNSTAVHIDHDGKENSGKPVIVTYVRGEISYQVSAKNCVFAGYNAILPQLCPALPSAQKDALGKAIKSPILYTNVLLKNWHAWEKLGIGFFCSPGSYYSISFLDFPISMGDYSFSAKPDDPIVVHMERFPTGNDPLLTPREQRLAGRHELYATSFETIERETREQLAGALAGGGFDPVKDIVAITANRWGHGYAYSNSRLFDAPDKNGQYPNEIGRQAFGRLVVANSDAGALADTDTAINEAYRAVGEL